ncbi:MAG: indole-3-glycerol phosphate synthase TrpC [Bacteroides sp.]|nr:indole-3-glycerol phosphate synthase TrpC [Roseburia sp.]MCM1346832.1 indole-3-glycerol phosphate synthase TrpC [Bacteroides sp.]MCM1420642.1 indole-3-glycerol phosphate synthase TrpC [Bacteroides sp.]
MKDILEEIIAWKRIEVDMQKKSVASGTLYKEVEDIIANGSLPIYSMAGSLQQSASGIIAEFKRKSPSKGWIKEAGKANIIPTAYAKNGAAALSILTDEKFFGGNMDFIRTARPEVKVPILRKDFIIDEYQLFQARAIGADAVLLIAAGLKKADCKMLARTAHELGLETLLEIHTESELDYVGENIDMVGVNNRHLGTFHTDVDTSYKLAEHLPSDYILVSESGISNPATVVELRKAGFKGFLIGETFMRENDPAEALRTFINQIVSQKGE